VVVLEWNLALVNINSVGYYAPVIAIRKFKKETSSEVPEYKALNCVLYEGWLQRQMEGYRIADIRDSKRQKFPVTHNISLFYFMRNLKKANNMAKNSSLAAMDYDQRVIRHDRTHPLHFVIVGDLKGTISFANAQNTEINEARLEQMNLHNIAMLFNGLKLNEEAKERKDKPKVLWSDSDSN
jgi:hypothetical protein